MNQLSYYGKTDSGCCRENNEDAYHLEQKGRYVIAVVADGIGGYDGGEIASYLACKCISDYLWNTPKKDFGSDVLKEMEQHLACMCYVGATRLYKYRDVNSSILDCIGMSRILCHIFHSRGFYLD